MLSKTCNDMLFDEVFLEVPHSETLELKNDSQLKIYQLPISNNEFDYINLKKLLGDNMRNYVFSRNKVKESGDSLVIEAQKKFRNLRNLNDKGAGGELGEFLLYIFLESQLNAMKLISKMELKTSNNDYVKGSDGIFLKWIDGKSVMYIIGEAKMNENFAKAIDAAFESVSQHKNKKDFEVNLVSDNIFKESVTQKEAELIARIIIPSHKSDVVKNDGFGIFIGYTFDLGSKNKNDFVTKELIEQKIIEDIAKIKTKLNEKILEYNLKNYTFYVYLVPFNDVMKDRVEIMKYILGEE